MSGYAELAYGEGAYGGHEAEPSGPDLTLAGQVPTVVGAFSLDAVQAVSLAGQIGAVVGAFALDAVQGVELAGTIAGPTGDFNMLVGNVDTVELAGTVPGVEGAFTLDAIQTVSLAGTIGGVTGAFTLQTGYEVTLAGQVGAVVGSFTLTQDDVEAITLAGTLPAVTGSFSLETSYISDPGPQNGISLGAYGVAEWEPAIVAPPAYPLIVHNYVAAEIYTSATMSGTRPTINGYARTYRINHRTRVIVAGRDLTYWRGIPTPPPSFGLVEPLLYGSGSLRLPQVAVPFEKAGQGSLSWLKPGANVKIQRVNTETGMVAATDWKGFLGVEDYSGGELRFQLEGEVTGRASMMDKQPPIFKRRQDLGFHWYDDITDTGQPFKPRGGPDTGINIYTYGGMGLLDHMQDLSAKGVNQDGAQWTCMPNSNGVYRVARKDLTTIAGTVYFTDSHTVADLRRDPAEETNRVFGTGVTPSGRRVKGAVFPVLADTNPPPFPGFMTQGDSGSDVDALIARLANTGYLSWDDRPGAYDSDVTRAVRRLQDDAELSETGNVNQATWEAMFDVEVTGYDIGGSHIEPLAQRSYTRRYRRTPDGNIIGRNRRYDRKRLKSDKTIDFGTSMNRQQIDRAAEGELTPDDANNWAGTITFHTGGLVNGTHVPGTPIVGADVKRARSLQPGDNLWAPLWDGGTVFHVSGVDVSEDGIVSATVDTQARDTMKVWEVLARNRENRRDPARAWIRTHRSSHFVKDAVTEFDEAGGVITDTDLAEGWNVLPVVAGMTGTIAQIRLEVDLPAEFVCAVFGRRVWPRWLAQRVGNPLSELGSENWTNEGVRRRLDNRVLLYAAGDDLSPCGYFPGTKPDSGFGAVTGRWEDDAGFAYRTFQNSCVLWLAVYVPTPVTLQGGRVMWNQIEAGS